MYLINQNINSSINSKTHLSYQLFNNIYLITKPILPWVKHFCSLLKNHLKLQTLDSQTL